MTKQDKINDFDPSSYADKGAGMFGLPFNYDESEVVLIPVPWEVTVSYGGGSAEGPEAIKEASYQVDLMDPFVHDAWKKGIFMQDLNPEIKDRNKALRPLAEQYIGALENGEEPDQELAEKIRTAGLWLNNWVKEQALDALHKGKAVAVVGGDHSTPLGLMQAMAEHFGEFGILQVDAHADLRDAYEGFEFSHASIMFNALKIPQLTKLVQVGIRDYCEDEFNIIQSDDRVDTYFDRDLKHEAFKGTIWQKTCEEIVSKLPENVYVSFDIDGLDPKLCPNTGTPVAGGFETEEMLFLLEMLVNSGRRIIGFDLCEVGPAEDNDWDANVGARLLYRLCNLMAKSKASN